MDNYRNYMSKEHLIMLIMAGAIIVFNLIGFIVSYFVWKDLSKDSDYIRENGRKLECNLRASKRVQLNFTDPEKVNNVLQGSVHFSRTVDTLNKQAAARDFICTALFLPQGLGGILCFFAFLYK